MCVCGCGCGCGVVWCVCVYVCVRVCGRTLGVKTTTARDYIQWCKGEKSRVCSADDG